MTATVPEQRQAGEPPLLVPALIFIALVVAAIGSLGAPLITSVATTFRVSLDSAQWTLTITLLSGAIATPLLGRLGAGPRRRGTIIAVLVIVTAGSALTVLPLPFGVLLAGRAAQGAGLGLTSLMIGVARDHLDARRAASTIALVSVASTIGAGVGYPVAGLLTEFGGVRAAYGLGAFVTLLALLTAVRSMPAPPPGRSGRLDVPGAALLTAGLFPVLLVTGETSLWTGHLAVAVTLAVAGAAILLAWTAFERRAANPLVDFRLLRHPAVAGANLAILTGGVGMYLLLTLITRYAQTPHAAGYGFGLGTFEAGLVLVPFSAFGFAAGKVTGRLCRRFGAAAAVASSALVVLAAFVLFGLDRSGLAWVLVAMAVLGWGVGGFFAAMPAVILAVTPASETSSAMSFNQVVRSVGFSVGSAAGGLILAAGTRPGNLVPADGAYTTAAWIGAAVMAFCAVTSWLSRLASGVGQAPQTGTTAQGEPHVTETLYEHAGGDEGLHRLEEIFYAKALADPVLRTLFTERVPTHVDHLTWFTAESFGGPDRFSRELGFQYIIDVHRHLKISDEQRERFVTVYLESLDEAGLPDDGPFRQAVREHVEFGSHVAQQNSWAQTDAGLHPIRAVPHWNWPA